MDEQPPRRKSRHDGRDLLQVESEGDHRRPPEGESAQGMCSSSEDTGHCSPEGVQRNMHIAGQETGALRENEM